MLGKSIKIGFVACAAALLLGLPAHAQETFKLGFVGGLTGYLAPYDQPSLDGLQFGVDEINAAGGLQGKMKVELISRDMRSETAESAVIAQELIGEGVNFLIVPCDVDPAVAAGQIAAAAGIPAMSSCASTPTLPGIVGEYMFSNYTADNLQAAALADYAVKQGYKNAFVMLSKDTPYTQKLPEYFTTAFQKKGGAIAGTVEYKMGQQDFAAEVTKLKALSPAPDVIMTSAYEPDFPAFIKALRAAGINTPVLGSDGIDSPTTLALGDVAEGVVFSNAGFVVEGSPLAKFYADFKAAKGKDPETVFVATGYDIIKVMDAALAASGGKVDGKSLRDAVDGLENVAVSTGKMTYKGMNRVPLRTVALNKVTGGAKALVAEVNPAPEDVPPAPNSFGMLEIHDLSVSYGPIQAVRGVSFSVAKGEIVALLGANGAGKSSILKAIMGIAPRSAGKVRLAGTEIDKADTASIVRRGMTLVPEGRRVFGQLSVLENLRVGAGANQTLRRNTTKNCERMYALFPKLAERSGQLAGSLSGGEQQMLAIARALMAEPHMLLLDEPSLGLAPNIVDQIFDFLKDLQKQGLTLLIVEQNAEVALDIASRGLVMAQGKIGKEGSAAALRSDEELERLYLGAS